MSEPNHHGTWEIRENRPDDKFGAPHPPTPLCSYCGSMSPESFIAAIRAGAKVGGSDWKYGWPHKFYVNVPNPNPDEVRVTGSRSVGGKTVDEYKGTYPTLPLKFYSEHLKDWGPLRDEPVRQLIEQATGIYFDQGDKGLKFRAPYHGYQR